jgi:hypothetical protein
MEVTKEFVDELLDHAAKMAKQKRTALGYSGEDRFVPVAIVVGPHGEQAILPMTHHDGDDKRIRYNALSQAARSEGALAILIVNDTRWANADAFAAYFHMPKIEEIGLDAWSKEYNSILWGVYGGSLGNCPREVWEEALVVAVKGPAITPTMKMMKYRKGAGDSIEWLNETTTETEKDAVGVKMNILPDWWEEPSGRPS